MKLIKKGNKLDQIWRGACSRCGSVFEATGGEILQGDVITWDPKSDPHANRECTECNADVKITNSVTLRPVSDVTIVDDEYFYPVSKDVLTSQYRMRWINIHRGNNTCSGVPYYYTSSKMYKSEIEAKAGHTMNYITSVKVEWETTDEG